MGRDHDRASGSLAEVSGTVLDRMGDDPLSDVLAAVRLTGSLFFVVEAAPPWIAAAPESSALAPTILPRGQHVVSYHVIVEGTCWCHLGSSAPVRLVAGDVLVVPHGDAYVLSSAPELRSGLTVEEILGWFKRMASGELPTVVTEGGAGPASLRIVCGFLGCDALPFNPILDALPRLLRIERPVTPENDGMRTLVDLIVAESRTRQAGSRSVQLRIGELLFVEAVRRHLATTASDAGGWLAGLRDPLVGRALARIHREPQRAWTIEALARETGSSRSVLAERFASFVGEPPIHYLTRWRMQRAAGLLAGGTAKVSAVARDVGYDSEAAFSRAFKKHTGTTPATWRDERRTLS